MYSIFHHFQFFYIDSVVLKILSSKIMTMLAGGFSLNYVFEPLSGFSGFVLGSLASQTDCGKTHRTHFNTVFEACYSNLRLIFFLCNNIIYHKLSFCLYSSRWVQDKTVCLHSQCTDGLLTVVPVHLLGLIFQFSPPPLESSGYELITGYCMEYFCGTESCWILSNAYFILLCSWSKIKGYLRENVIWSTYIFVYLEYTKC